MLKVGYINHALDEYRHSKLIFEVLNNEVKRNKDYFNKEFRFTPQNVVLKGYVDKKNFLVEKLKLKNFVEFVYANEFLAKDSFDNLIKRIENTDSLKILKQKNIDMDFEYLLLDNEKNNILLSNTEDDKILKSSFFISPAVFTGHMVF